MWLGVFQAPPIHRSPLRGARQAAGMCASVPLMKGLAGQRVRARASCPTALGMRAAVGGVSEQRREVRRSLLLNFHWGCQMRGAPEAGWGALGLGRPGTGAPGSQQSAQWPAALPHSCSEAGIWEFSHQIQAPWPPGVSWHLVASASKVLGLSRAGPVLEPRARGPGRVARCGLGHAKL